MELIGQKKSDQEMIFMEMEKVFSKMFKIAADKTSNSNIRELHGKSEQFLEKELDAQFKVSWNQ